MEHHRTGEEHSPRDPDVDLLSELLRTDLRPRPCALAATQLLGKPEFPIPEPKPEAIEKFFDCAATQAKTYTNKFLGVFYRIAKGHEPALSLKAAFILYISAKLTGMFTLLTLAYVACVGAFAGPKVYVLYKEDIDKYIGIAKVKVDEVVGQAKEFVNDKVLSKIKPPQFYVNCAT